MLKKWIVWVAVLVLGLLGTAIEAEAQKFGGKMIIAQGTDAAILDAHYITCSPSATVSEHITEPLLEITPEGKMVENLARFEVSPDLLVWTLHLRKGVKFHDGEPFNAAAVKLNLDRILDKACAIPFRFLIARVTKVEVAGEYTVKLHTAAPFAPMPAHLTHSTIAMHSPKQLKALWDKIKPCGKGLEDKPIGTGPFKFVEWKKGERILLKRNEDYWGLRPYLDEVEFRPIPEDAARMIALEKGEVHVAVRVPPHDVPRLEKDPRLRLDFTSSVRTIYIGFNVWEGKPKGWPYLDKRVRHAINHCVNKEAITDVVLGRMARVSDAPISPGIFGYTPVGKYAYDVAKAKALLKEAGFEKGFKTKLYHPTGRYIRDAAVAEAVQAMLKECGIDAELITMEWAAYLEFTKKPPAESLLEMYLLGWGTVTLDADYGLYPLFHSTQWVPAGPARSFYKNPKVDELLDKGRTTADPEVRKKVYAEAMKIIWDDAPWLFLYSESQITGISRRAKGVIVHPVERVIVWGAWLD